MGVIYKITNSINYKIYIGKTINLQKRIAKYKRSLKKESSQNIIKSMKKYGFENFMFEIIYECESLDELNDKEKYFINSFNSMNEEVGYNMTSGGDGGDTLSKHINKEMIFKKRNEKYRGNNVFQYRHDLDEHVKEMIELNSSGWSVNDLSKKYKCSTKAIMSRLPNYKKISSSNHHIG